MVSDRQLMMLQGMRKDPFDIERLQQEFELKKQAAQRLSQGSTPAAIKIANEIQQRRAMGDEAGAALIENAAKMYDKGVQYDPQSGQYVDMTGYAGALGNLEYGKNYGGETATQQVRSAYEPARQEEIRRRESEVDLQYKPQTEYETTMSRERAQTQSERIANLGKVEEKARYMLDTIDQLLNPEGGLAEGAGSISGGMFGLQGRQASVLPLGKNQRKYQPVVDQIKGQVFLDAYETLKGGGVITEIEGEKAERARARLSQAQDDADFEAALRELREVVQTGLERARGEAIDPMSASRNAIMQRNAEGIQNPYRS